MIKQILDLLAVTDSKAEVVQQAKGKYKFPDTFSEAFKRLKQENEWRK